MSTTSDLDRQIEQLRRCEIIKVFEPFLNIFIRPIFRSRKSNSSVQWQEKFLSKNQTSRESMLQ